MELRQLRSFVKAAETLNFSEAAKELFVTQSTFSQNIKKLEDELRVSLFHRNSHDVSLTEAGMELLPYARQTILQSEQCVERVSDLMNLRKGTLNIGVTHSFSVIASETVLKFMKAYPGIQLNIFYKTMDELMDMLTNRQVDFVLSYRPSQHYCRIESHSLFEDKLSVVVREGHPLENQKSVSLTELQKYPLALPSRGLQARNVLDYILSKEQVDLNATIELNEVMPILQLVERGSIVTVLSGASVDLLSKLKAIPLESDYCTMDGCFHILKDSYRKFSVKEFIRLLCETSIIQKKRSNWF